MKRLLLLSIALLVGCGGVDGTPKSKHILIVGIDGARVDVLQQASTPRLDALVAEGTVTYDAFAGGELGTPTEQGTWSGPGWSSILTGVWVDKHGVRFNSFVAPRFDEYPHFFARVHERDPNVYLSSFVTWGPIHEEILASAYADEAFWPEDASDSAEGDEAVTAAVVAHLAGRTPNVVFVQLDEVDHQGHVVGYSTMVPEYVAAVETVDSQIGEMLDAIRARDTYAREDWLVVVTTDHGGIGNGHGGQSEDERTIFVIVTGGTASAGQTVSPGPGHTVVPPTVMEHLGIPVDPAWGWEDESFGL